MLKRNVIFLLTFMLLIAFLFPSNAQRRFEAGLVLGITAAQINGDDSAQFNKLGITGGLKVNTIFTEKSSISVEILFSQRGSQTELFPSNGILQQKIHLDYIEVPVLFNFKDWWNEDSEYYKMHFQGGFSYGRLFNSSFENSSFEEVAPFFRENDVSWIIGMTFFANKHLGFYARYTRSINHLFVNTVSNPNANSLLGYFLSFGSNYIF